MLIPGQMYHGQFQKHEPMPLIEQDIEPHVMSDEGPVASPWVSQAALRRSIGELCFHAGFEEFQPSALDAFTELAGEYFTKLATSLLGYSQAPKTAVQQNVPDAGDKTKVTWKTRFTQEEMILHTLQDNGTDLDALDTYVSEDIDRAGSRITIMHERMKAHLADLLRPALHDAGPDGSNAFNDGSEQFVGGDFAEELGEDFFGFRELGLDVEFGMGSLSVPLHLLQNRMHQANQAQNPGYVSFQLRLSYVNTDILCRALSTSATSFLPTPPPLPPLTLDNVSNQIGLVQNFFLAKLHAQNDNPLIEDDDLPQKQRFPKPRLPPTGKISSPRKRPIREPGPGKGHPRKKMKLDEAAKESTAKDVKAGEKDKPPPKASAKAGLLTERNEGSNSGLTGLEAPKDKEINKEKEKEKSEASGMISPESLEAT